MAEEFSAGQEQQEEKVDRKEKKARKRKKGAYRRLVAQMEFYFSDANLRMSKFLAAIYLADPWVPLDTFLTFNKVEKSSQLCFTVICSLGGRPTGGA